MNSHCLHHIYTYNRTYTKVAAELIHHASIITSMPSTLTELISMPLSDTSHYVREIVDRLLAEKGHAPDGLEFAGMTESALSNDSWISGRRARTCAVRARRRHTAPARAGDESFMPLPFVPCQRELLPLPCVRRELCSATMRPPSMRASRRCRARVRHSRELHAAVVRPPLTRTPCDTRRRQSCCWHKGGRGRPRWTAGT
jgi:hypothetical protein